MLSKKTCDIYKKARNSWFGQVFASGHRFVIFRVYSHSGVMKHYTKLNTIRNHVLFDAPPDPYATIKVDPANVIYRNRQLKAWRGLAQVEDGAWDLRDNVTKVRDFFLYTGLTERFEEGLPWKETEYYQHAKYMINDQGSYWGYDTIDDFHEERCSFVDKLYESMKKHGYLQTPEQDQPNKDSRRWRRPYLHSLHPLVCIGRDGEMHINDGLHRFTIADILGINIQAQVLGRHVDWQRYRDEVYSDERFLKRNCEHPDLSDIS